MFRRLGIRNGVGIASDGERSSRGRRGFVTRNGRLHRAPRIQGGSHAAAVAACQSVMACALKLRRVRRGFCQISGQLAESSGRGQKPRQSFICNRYRCSGRVADWLGSLGYPSFLKDS